MRDPLVQRQEDGDGCPGQVPKGFPPDLVRSAVRKLAMIAAAHVLDDLRAPPGNRLELLKGDRAKQYSIRINDQWRIWFEWSEAGPRPSKSSTTIRAWRAVMEHILPPVHPGEVLKEEFLVPLGLSAGALARRIGVPRTRIERVVKEETSITTDTALRLAKVFGTTPEFWTNLQSRHDIQVAAKELATELAGIEVLEGVGA